MSRCIIGITVLLVLVAVAIGFIVFQHYKKPLFTSSYLQKLSRDIALHPTHNSYTMAIGSNLFTISSHPLYIDIESSDWTYKNCQIVVDDNDKITGKIRAAALGEKILLWSFDEINYEDFKSDARQANYTLLMLDPWRCNYTALTHFKGVVPKILVNKKSVDVLCPNKGNHCLSRRFDEAGQMYELQPKIVPESWDQAFLEGFNQDQNYVYASNDEYGMKVMRILDQNFHVLKQASFNFTIENLAVSSLPTKSQIGILYEEPKHRFHIAVFDSNLQLVFTTKLPEPNDEYEATKSYLTMDSHGNSFVTFILVNKTEKYHLLRYNADGHLVSQHDLDEYWRNEPLETQTFLIDDTEFCLVNHQKTFGDDLYGHTYIKCIDIS